MINDKQIKQQLFQGPLLQRDSYLVSFLLLHQTLVVPRNFHRQILFRLDQELHPGFTLLQEGLLLQQEGLEFAAKSKQNTSF